MKCSVCKENEISPRSRTGICKRCLVRRSYNHNYKSPRKKVDAICYKCHENFEARYDQDPKYSLCPQCKKRLEDVGKGFEWVRRKSYVGRNK